MYDSLAIAAELQGICHETSTILANIECMLPVMGRIRIAVRNNHLDNTDTVEKSALPVLVHVVGADIGDDDTLTVVEADVHLVVGPRQLVAADLEGNTLRLGDIDRLQAVVNISIADELREIVVLLERDGSPLAVDSAHVNTEHLLALGVGDNGEIQRVGILVVELGGPVVDQTLLQTAI